MSYIRKIVKVSELIPNKENPRTVTEQAMQELESSLQDFPELLAAQAIFCDQDLIVYGGNQRLQALINLGVEYVEVVIYDLPKEQIETMSIRSNVNTGDWHLPKLKKINHTILKAGGVHLTIGTAPTLKTEMYPTILPNEYETSKTDDPQGIYQTNETSNFAPTNQQAKTNDKEALQHENDTVYQKQEYTNEVSPTLFPLPIAINKSEKQVWDKVKEALKSKGYKGTNSDKNAFAILLLNYLSILPIIPNFETNPDGNKS